MSEEDVSGGSPRGIQLAMLAAVGVTLLLSDPPEAGRRIETALVELGRWPADAATIREALRQQCDAQHGQLDLPDDLKLAWFDSHRYEGKVYAGCVSLQNPKCDALANVDRLSRVAPGSLPGASLNDYACQVTASAQSAATADWRVRSLTDDGALDGALSGSLTAYKSWQDELGKVRIVCNDLAVAKKEYDDDHAKYINAAHPDKRNKANAEADAAIKLLTIAASRFGDALQGFAQASREVRNRSFRTSGSHVILESSTLDSYLVTNVPPIAGAGVPPPAEGSIAECLAETRLFFGPCKDGKDPHRACPESTQGTWDFDKLTRAGVWADVRDFDVASAESHLRDAKSKTELETEVLGLKLGSADALRWLWLPILAAEVLSLCSLWLAKPSKQAGEDWWLRWPCQCAVGAAALIGIVVSITSHFRLRSEQEGSAGALVGYTTVVTLACVATAGILATALFARSKAKAEEPAPPSLDRLGPQDTPNVDSSKATPKDEPG